MTPHPDLRLAAVLFVMYGLLVFVTTLSVIATIMILGGAVP